MRSQELIRSLPVGNSHAQQLAVCPVLIHVISVMFLLKCCVMPNKVQVGFSSSRISTFISNTHHQEILIKLIG